MKKYKYERCNHETKGFNLMNNEFGWIWMDLDGFGSICCSYFDAEHDAQALFSNKHLKSGEVGRAFILDAWNWWMPERTPNMKRNLPDASMEMLKPKYHFWNPAIMESGRTAHNMGFFRGPCKTWGVQIRKKPLGTGALCASDSGISGCIWVHLGSAGSIYPFSDGMLELDQVWSGITPLSLIFSFRNPKSDEQKLKEPRSSSFSQTFPLYFPHISPIFPSCFPHVSMARTEGPTPWKAATWAPALLPEPKPKPAMWCCSGEATVRCSMIFSLW